MSDPPRRPPIPEGPYLVVGLARSGVAAASALRRLGAGEVIGADAGAVAAAARLREEGVEVHERSDGLELLDRVATVVKSPGVPAQAPAIAKARERGITVIGELELAWRMLESPTIAVTGTNGKTTTVHLIAAIHREAGLPVAVAGNVGLALSALAGRIDGSVRVVCEASSFQLQDAIAFAPEVAVLLNISPDHLDRHGSLQEYVEAKLQAFARQREGDVAVLPSPEPALGRSAPAQGALSDRIAELGGRARILHAGTGERAEVALRDGQLIWRAPGEPERTLIGVADLRIRGAHNLANAMAAAAACLASGIAVEAVRAGLASFAGVEHRLEEVASRQQVLYVNDSKATNVASTLVALAAFTGRGEAEPDVAPGRSAGDTGAISNMDGEGRGLPAAPARGAGWHARGRRRIHLILGGQGKGQDFGILREPVAESCAAVYLIGQDAPSIAAALEGIEAPVRECGDLESALRSASAAARRELAADRWVDAARGGAGGDRSAGQVVLLSPGCASFDQFEDFEARGQRFREIVAAL